MTESLAKVSALGVLQGGSKGWKWTKKKRKAIRLVLKGYTNRQIGSELSVNERTVRRWRKTAEFHAELITKAREYADSKRYRRMHETGVLTDQMSVIAAQKLKEVRGKDSADVSQVDLNALQLYLREYREFKTSEKIDFGDDPRSGGGISINIGIGGVAPGADVGSAGSQSFKSFIEEHLDQIPSSTLSDAGSPQEALVNITEALVENTALVEELYEEDKAMAEVEAAEKAK